MRTRLSLPPALYPLVVAGLAATAVHGLLLSYLQLRRSHHALPTVLRSRDNTPELLQFSSQPVPLTALESIPLPKASILPPPPPPADLLRPLGRPEAPPSPSEKKGSTPQRKDPVRPTVRKQPSSPVARTPRPVVSSGLMEGAVADALKHLRSSKEGAPPPDQGLEPSAGDDARTSPPERITEWSADQQQALQELWSAATPWRANSVQGVDESGAAGIEIRQLPLQLGTQSRLPIKHRQKVVLKDRIILFWLDRATLWLLQTGREPSTSG